MSIGAAFMNMVESSARAISSIHAPWSRKKILTREVIDIIKFACPGDVILSASDGELGNLFIKGEWKHAAICMGFGYLVEAKTKGVAVTDMNEFAYTKDRIAVLRPVDVPSSKRLEACEWARRRIGLPYDFRFDTSAQSLYCSELVVKAYEATGTRLTDIEPEFRFGSPVYYPQAFRDAADKSRRWELVYMTNDAW